MLSAHDEPATVTLGRPEALVLFEMLAEFREVSMFQCAMKPRDSLSLWHRLFHDSRGTTLPLDSMRAATQSAPDTAFPPHRAFRLRSVYLRTEDRRLSSARSHRGGRGELISENGNVFRGFADLAAWIAEHFRVESAPR
jgi:hypothetical protein